MSEDTNEVSQQVRAFVVSNFYLPDPSALADDSSLLDHGVIDSTGVLEVIGFVEQTFGITVDDSDMVPENLDSIARITAFVVRKRGQPRSQPPPSHLL